MASIKFLNIIDKKIDYLDQIEEALLQQKQTYKDGNVDIGYENIYVDMPNFWTTEGNLTYVTVREVVKNLPEAYTVAFVIHPDNWKDKNAWVFGWHLGKHNGYQVQLIKGYGGNIKANYRSFIMEGMHSWDTPIREKLGINLSEYLGVDDYDHDLVHGMVGQGVTLSQEKSIEIFGEEYTKWDYVPLIKRLAPLLNKIFNPMQLTRKQVEKIYILFGMGTADEEALTYWTGKELDALLDVRLNDLQSEIHLVKGWEK